MENGFDVRLTVIDTPGFGDYMNNQNCWVPVIDFLDEQHNAFYLADSGSNRANIDDLRVHACLYFIQPTGHTLKPLDILVMKKLCTRVNLIPVVAKADTVTPTEMAAFKDRVRECLVMHNITYFTPPVDEDHEDLAKTTREITSAVPFAVISSEEDVTVNGKKVRGREYLWGVAEVENETHCDFVKLRNLLIRLHMHDLIRTTQDTHYENYRSNFLISIGQSDDDPASRSKKLLAKKLKEDEEALRKRFTDQVRQEEKRFRQWEQRVKFVLIHSVHELKYIHI